MDQSEEKLYAVLTGDIVKSSKLSADGLQAVKHSLREAVRDLNLLPEDKQPIVEGTIDFYRGDGWQLLLTCPEYALRAALFLRARLMMTHPKTDTRISVGIGPVAHVSSDNVSQSIGKAFELSGNAMDTLKARTRMTIAFPYYMEDKYVHLVSVFELSDAIVQKWTHKQAEAASWALRGLSQAEIAAKFNPPITSQAVGKFLRTACWHALEAVLERIENNDHINRQ